jgi:hypothetical protein
MFIQFSGVDCRVGSRGSPLAGGRPPAGGGGGFCEGVRWRPPPPSIHSFVLSLAHNPINQDGKWKIGEWMLGEIGNCVLRSH